MSALDPLVQFWNNLTQPQVDPKTIPGKSSDGEKLNCTPTGIPSSNGKSIYLCEPETDFLDEMMRGIEGIFGSTLEEFTDRLRAHTSSRTSAPEDIPPSAPQAGGPRPPEPSGK